MANKFNKKIISTRGYILGARTARRMNNHLRVSIEFTKYYTHLRMEYHCFNLLALYFTILLRFSTHNHLKNKLYTTHAKLVWKHYYYSAIL